jgi:mRNA interferase MazF
VPERGDVWLVDFGAAAKVRPALVISVAFEDEDRALIGVIPHTTSTRGSRFEVVVPAGFLKQGAFMVQGVPSLPPKFFLRKLGRLSAEQLQTVEKRLLDWLGVLPS